MLQIGVTGGMGSGKSTVCKIFVVLDIPVYYADDRAKFLMNNHDLLREAIQKDFGLKSFGDKGNLDTGFLAAQVFDNPTKLEKLNALVHPHVFEDYRNLE